MPGHHRVEELSGEEAGSNGIRFDARERGAGESAEEFVVVDAENGFCALIRSSYICSVDLEDGRLVVDVLQLG